MVRFISDSLEQVSLSALIFFSFTYKKVFKKILLPLLIIDKNYVGPFSAPYAYDVVLTINIIIHI